MPKVINAVGTSMAYDGGREARIAGEKWRIVLQPGVNTLSEADVDLLMSDETFHRQKEKGFYLIKDDEPVPAAKAKGKDAPAPGKAELDKFVADYLALAPEAQAAMAPTLTPEQKVAIEAKGKQ